MRQAGLRIQVDERSEKLGYKIREAQLEKIPLMLVVGDRELADNTVAVRTRDAGDQGSADPTALTARLVELVRDRRLDLDLGGVTRRLQKKTTATPRS
jgi:threonyl-tRNA synthetase